jgi:hypothetical protein
MEVVDVRPAPEALLGEVTARLGGFYAESATDPTTAIRLLALDGFDVFEGTGRDGPTYPFRSKFQFDENYRWLFLGRDWGRLQRLFKSYHLPLYQAATDLTPKAWRA